MIYLASPYSHPDPAVRAERFKDVCRYAANRIRLGDLLFSPIVYGHHLAEEHGCGSDFAFWERFDSRMLRSGLIKEVRVLTLPGWHNSIGIRAEIALAEELKIPVSYVDFHEKTY